MLQTMRLFFGTVVSRTLCSQCLAKIASRPLNRVSRANLQTYAVYRHRRYNFNGNHRLQLINSHPRNDVTRNNAFQAFGKFSSALESKASADLEFPMRFEYVRTSTDRWIDYPDGVQFDVGYVDTNFTKCASPSAPVILGLPSSVGTHEELTSSLFTFAKLGCRVIILNLPDSQLCLAKPGMDGTVFMQTVPEKADFIVDFLRKIHVERIDLVVSNSCSVYTAVYLATFNKGLVKSLAMINPTGFEYTGDMLPLFYHKHFSNFWDNRFVIQPLLRVIVSAFKIFTSKRNWTSQRIVTYSRMIRSLSLDDVAHDGSNFKTRKLPILAIYGDNSMSFDQASSLEYLKALGLPESAIIEYTEDADKTSLVKGMKGLRSVGVYVPGAKQDLLETHVMFVRLTLLQYLKTIRPDF